RRLNKIPGDIGKEPIVAKSASPVASTSAPVQPIRKEIPPQSAPAASPPAAQSARPAAPPPRDPARDSALGRAVQQIEKQFGKGAVMKLDEEPKAIEGIKTGSLSLDIALGGAGVPRGRVVEIFGPESSGKTTLALHIIANAQKNGGLAVPQMGLQARLMSQALRKLTAAISRSRTTVIFINQIREKIGVMFGNPETTPGGRALKFYSSVRIDVRRTQTIKEAEVSIGA